MRAESARRLSRLLFVLALVGILSALVWALRTPPAPNADRYDYAGRAFQALQGHGLSALVQYPLRMVFPGAEAWPAVNLTRSPLWPLLLVPGVHWGLDARSGVWLAGVFAILLLVAMRWVGDRSFGGAAGSMAGLALASSYCTWTVLWGGGPEVAVALLTLVIWTWIPRGGGVIAHLACGTLYGLLPLLHPTGWIFAAAAFLARSNRYERSKLVWVLLGVVLVALPWHLRLWIVTGNPLGMLQSYAELARNLDDPAGMGPYRGLHPHATAQILGERGGEVVRLAIHRLKVQILHFDAWLSWPLVALALFGAAKEPRLAMRDVLLGVGVFAILASWTMGFRIFFPLLPIACLWVGAGFARLVDRVRPLPAWVLLALFAVVGPWVLPLGTGVSPLRQPNAWSRASVAPPFAVIHRLRELADDGAPVFTDSAVLAWQARVDALLLPIDPPTLEALRFHPALMESRVLALGLGRNGPWCAGDDWQGYLLACTPLFEHPEGPVILRLPSAFEIAATDVRPSRGDDPPDSTATASPAAESPLPAEPIVDRTHPLTADYLPDDLVELPVPPATREGLRLRATAAAALRELVASARQDSVELRVVSAHRDYARQRELFDSAEARHGEGQRWVARPGTSEHQLGTTVDFADARLEHVLEQSFGETAEGRWLASHAPRFGFTMSYPPGSLERTGYHPEPWHFRYRGAPTAAPADSLDADEAKAGSR